MLFFLDIRDCKCNIVYVYYVDSLFDARVDLSGPSKHQNSSDMRNKQEMPNVGGDFGFTKENKVPVPSTSWLHDMSVSKIIWDQRSIISSFLKVKRS